MPVALFSIASSLHDDIVPLEEDALIEGIQREMGEKFILRGDFSDYYSYSERLIYVRTGGSEEIFRDLNLKGDIRLLTSGKENSLAAAMEILSFVKSHGNVGEILHGTPAQIAARINHPAHDADSVSHWIRHLPDVRLDARVGVVGMPSDWQKLCKSLHNF